MKREHYLMAETLSVQKTKLEEVVQSLSSTDAIWLLRRVLAPSGSEYAETDDCIKIVWDIKHRRNLNV
jgi:hypothetical protein